MGIHQHPLVLFPRQFFEARGKSIPRSIPADERDGFEDIDTGFWSHSPPSDDLLVGLRSLFLNDTSWGDCEQYKSAHQWGSDIQIWRDEGRIFTIQYRVAPVAQEWQPFHDFVALAARHDCLLLDVREGRVLQPDYECIIEMLRDSRSVQFAVDPLQASLDGARDMATKPVEPTGVDGSPSD